MSTRVQFVDPDEGQKFIPKQLETNITLLEAGRRFALELQGTAVIIGQQTIKDLNKTLAQIKEDLKITSPYLPIRYFSKAIGGHIIS